MNNPQTPVNDPATIQPGTEDEFSAMMDVRDFLNSIECEGPIIYCPYCGEKLVEGEPHEHSHMHEADDMPNCPTCGEVAWACECEL